MGTVHNCFLVIYLTHIAHVASALMKGFLSMGFVGITYTMQYTEHTHPTVWNEFDRCHFCVAPGTDLFDREFL